MVISQKSKDDFNKYLKGKKEAEKKTTFFQINEGVLKFAFQGTAKDLKKQVEADIKESVKKLQVSIKDTKAELSKPLKDSSLETKAIEIRNKINLKANEKELVRVKAMTYDSFEFYPFQKANLNG